MKPAFIYGNVRVPLGIFLNMSHVMVCYSQKNCPGLEVSIVCILLYSVIGLGLEPYGGHISGPAHCYRQGDSRQSLWVSDSFQYILVESI